QLLQPCLSEADLSLVGRVATRWDVVRFLSNLLQMRDAERRDPAIEQQRVTAPIFITGLPRSGTTFLHRMLMEDPANRAPLVWQAIHPYPPPRGADRRKASVARQLRTFEWLAPEFRDLHPLKADSPQECSEITAHVFRSLRFDSTYNIPSYRAWLDTDLAGHLPAYRFHRRFLQHLQQADAGWTAETRWVLKCPDHLFALDALRAVYPDARLVFVHRDPVKVLLSVAKLTEVLRRPFSRHVDPLAIGRQESARWFDGTRRMIAASDADGDSAICHVHYLDLVSDPVATVEQVYQHFDMALSPAAAQAMARYVAARPNGGYGPHRYRFEDHGLDPDAERAKFRPYMLHFGIEAEAAPDGPRRAAPQKQTQGALPPGAG
ncbi:MAG TPA: sulfotransferase, partial [Acetobacteraceae bacterium]|nr:sulfotransferase [Acetobacteraceae bacterium]